MEPELNLMESEMVPEDVMLEPPMSPDGFPLTMEENPEVSPDVQLLEPEQQTNDEVSGLPEGHKTAFLDVGERIEKLDESIRYIRNRLYKKLVCYLEGKQLGIFWDADDQTWRYVADEASLAEDEDFDIDQFGAKVGNIFKPNIISVIAALTAGTPKVKYVPDDADAIADIDTASAYQLIQRKIEKQKQTRPKKLITKALRIKYTQGLCFGYVYPVEDGKGLGYYNEPDIQLEKKANWTELCTNCGAPVNSGIIGESEPAMMEGVCPNCRTAMFPEVVTGEEESETVIGYNSIPKCRIAVDLYGPLNVWTPFFVTSLEQVPVLSLRYESHWTQVKEAFDLPEDPTPDALDNAENDPQVRLPVGWIPDRDELVTVCQRWYRPWSFNMIEDEQIRTELKNEYPEGACVVFINDIPVKAWPENIDEHWVTTEDPFSDFLHCVPEGQDLVDIQDLFNEVLNLTADTIEHNIPETFVDSTVVDLQGYKTTRARPGNITGAKPRAGQNLAAAFHETAQSSLSQEHAIFSQKLMELGQLTIGAQPTIYGGQLKGGSGTAREYESSRAMALQRLSPMWDQVKEFYAALMSLAVPLYAQCMMEDEKYVESLPSGAYLNVYIEKKKLEGKVGEITYETDEQLPVSWAEKRDILRELIMLNNPVVGELLLHPENSTMVASLLGLPELFIPGNDDRQKQLAEIADLLKQAPVPNPQFAQFQQALQTDLRVGMAVQQGMLQPPPELTTSIQPDPDLDNHQVEAETCSAWLKSQTGRAMKQINPQGWENVKLHFLAHKNMAMMQMQQQAMMNPQQEEQAETSEQ